MQSAGVQGRRAGRATVREARVQRCRATPLTMPFHRQLPSQLPSRAHNAHPAALLLHGRSARKCPKHTSAAQREIQRGRRKSSKPASSAHLRHGLCRCGLRLQKVIVRDQALPRCLCVHRHHIWELVLQG